MNLTIFASVLMELPPIPEEIDRITLVEDTRIHDVDKLLIFSNFISWSSENGKAAVLITTDAENIPEELLEQLAEITVSQDPLRESLTSLTDNDVVFLAWDDSDFSYRALRSLSATGATVVDMTDGFQILEIGDAPDFDLLVDELTKRVTAEVLKVVRAEIKEAMSSRRWRSTAKRA